jgi:hypothetical protein
MAVVARVTAAKGLEASTFVENPDTDPLPYDHNQIGSDYSGWRPPQVWPKHGFMYDRDRCRIVLGTNPWGRTDYLWQVTGRDSAPATTTRNSGGITDAAWISQDGNDHRFSIWQRREGPLSTAADYGRSYWGISDTGGDVIRADDGTVATNPYWHTSLVWLETGMPDWVLFVGHVYKEGTAPSLDLRMHPDSGIYSMDGTNLRTTFAYTDYIAAAGSRWRYRVFQYRANFSNCRTLYYRPRIDTLDGSEPTIAELLAGTETGDAIYRPKHIYPDGAWSHGQFDETALSATMSATTLGATGMTEI